MMAKRSVLSIIALKMIDIYQKYISPFLGNNCRFYPSCSQYTLEAIEKYGAIRGSFKGILRILRCNPLFPGGYDPLD
jgi:uncharacterized protein